MVHGKSGRPSKGEIKNRREQVKELFLQGNTINHIANLLGVAYATVQADIQHIEAHYTKLVMNNQYLAERQFGHVEKLLDEIKMVQKEYWALYSEILETVEEGKQAKKQWEIDLKQAEINYQMAKDSGDQKATREALQHLENCKRPLKVPSYITSRIDTLKAILDRVDKESKLLSLFNPKNLIDKEYVSVDVLKSIMEVFKTIIVDLIPEDKRPYAFQRLKTIDIDTLTPEDVVDKKL